MPMGLMWANTYFKFFVEIVLLGEPSSHPLPIVIYLNNIAIYGATQKQLLENMLGDIKWLTTAGLIFNLHKI